MFIERDELLDRNMQVCDVYKDWEITVHFAGVLNGSQFYDLPMHRNEGFEICIIPSGKGFLKIDDSTWPISYGQITISKPHEVHTCWPSKDDPFRMYYICFSFNEQLGPESTLYKVKEQLEQITGPVLGDGYRLHEHIRRIIYEISYNDSYSKELIKCQLVSLLLCTLRCFESIEADTGMENERSILVEKTIYYIDHNIGEAFDLYAISKTLNYSVSHLSRSFKQQTGYSIKEYYNMTRLEQAKKELQEGKFTITNIAEKYGYYDIQHFSKAFKHFFGFSPSKIIQKHD